MKREVQALDEVSLVDFCRFLRRAIRIGDAIELDDRPAIEPDVVERLEDSRQIDTTSPELHEAIRIVERLDVLQMKHLNPFTVLPDCRDGIAAGLLIMRDVEQQPDVTSICGVEDRG